MENSTFKREDIVTNGCIGSCCEAFHLPYTPEEFQRIKEAYLDPSKDKFMDRYGEQRHLPGRADNILFVIDMLIPLGESSVSYETGEELIEQFKKQFPNQEPKKGVFNNMIVRDGKIFGIYYTCKHFDREKRICNVYENRPPLCRAFPINACCNYKGCQMKMGCKQIINP